jgi:hypothetical protein
MDAIDIRAASPRHLRLVSPTATVLLGRESVASPGGTLATTIQIGILRYHLPTDTLASVSGSHSADALAGHSVAGCRCTDLDAAACRAMRHGGRSARAALN